MSSARRPGGGGDGGRRGSRGGNATKKQSSTSAARALNVSLPSVAVVPASLEETHFAPLRAWLQRFWLRGQLLPAQLEVDRMVDIAAALCIQNYTAQFRSTVLHVHEGAFKVLAAAAHRNWRLQDDVALGSASAGAGGSGSDGRGRQVTNGSGDDGARARRLLAAARRDYVEAVRRLAVVGKVCAFHDGNHPRDSLAAKLVARLKHHLLEKDKAVAGTLRRLLGDPGDATTAAAAAVVAWAECFPEPNAKALRVAPSDAHVAYDNAGNRHWEKKPPAPRAQLSFSPSSSPLSSPTARGSAGGDGIGGSNSISAKSPPPPLKPADAVVVSSGGGTLVTTTETKNACLPLLPGEVPLLPRDGGGDGNPDPGVGSGGGGGGDTAAAAGGSERGGGGGGGGGGDGGGGASALTGADRAHVRLAGAELKLGETVTPYRENRAMHAELRYSDTAADELLEDGERTVERLRETIDDLADRILDVQTGTGIGDVRHWAPERLQRLQQLLALRAQKEEQLEAAESRAQAIDAQKEVRDMNLENVEYKLTALHGALRRSKKDRAFNFYKWRRRRNPGQFPDQVQQQLAARRAQQVYRPPQKAYNHFEVVQAAKERALRERRQALGILAADGETDGDDGKGAETAVAAGGGEAAAVSGGVPATASISNGGSVLPAGKDDSEQLGDSDAAVSVAVTSTRNESVAATATPKESTSAVVVAAATETASEGDCVGGAEPKGASDGEGDNTHHTDAGEPSERDAAHTEDPRAAAGDGGGGDDDDSDCSSDSFDARFL